MSTAARLLSPPCNNNNTGAQRAHTADRNEVEETMSHQRARASAWTDMGGSDLSTRPTQFFSRYYFCDLHCVCARSGGVAACARLAPQSVDQSSAESFFNNYDTA
ncbi:hypothetical protein EVAR_97428_1 [Eumeta japonica]|uniref:Uncharacterized protein n=1 Tax=Eumeta variegata TaxID=151549 RepID=A0A4C1X112_EUMVA|nr:hypothetical protein EVAR_97428_1 [Eumeta japonica]